MNNTKLKILVIGPTQCGKSTLSNYLAGKSDVISNTYRPTVGLRVLKTSKTVVHKYAPDGEDIDINLWDLSCDPKYENGWAAAKQDCDGIIIVQNGDIRFNEQDFQGIIINFPKDMGIQPSLCLGFLHHPSGNVDPVKHQDFARFGLQLTHSSVEDGRSSIIPRFESFLSKILTAKYDAERQQEDEDLDEY